MIQEGGEMVRPAVLHESPEFIRELLVYLSESLSAAYDGIKVQFLRLISGMAVVLHGDRHPISILCQLLQTLHGNQDLIILAMSKIRDILKRQLGPTHVASIVTQRRLCYALLKQRRYHEAEHEILDVISICERAYGRNDFYTRYSLHGLAGLYYSMSRNSEAENILVDILQRGKKLGDCDAINIRAKRLRGLIQFSRGNYTAAEAFLWSALSGSLLAWGPRDPETVHTWTDYQGVTASLQKSHETFPE
jgi:hypothetical protein